MKKILRFSLVLALSSLFFGSAEAQVLTAPPVPLHPWEKGNVPGLEDLGKTNNRKPVPYVHIREADVMWSKRIWQTIDLREKINHPLYYPVMPVRDRKSFTMILWDAVVEEQVVNAYMDEDFTQLMTAEDIKNATSRLDTDWIPSLVNPDLDSMIVIREEFRPTDVKQYRIVEDWFFDRERSVMDVRIMGMAPLVDLYIEDPATGELEFKGQKDLFWIYFPQARDVLAKNEVYNRFNDAERMSYDDLFYKRMFSSFIIKEENVHDRMINEYAKGLDALIEAERIKAGIQDFESGLWEF